MGTLKYFCERLNQHLYNASQEGDCDIITVNNSTVRIIRFYAMRELTTVYSMQLGVDYRKQLNNSNIVQNARERTITDKT